MRCAGPRSIPLRSSRQGYSTPIAHTTGRNSLKLSVAMAGQRRILFTSMSMDTSATTVPAASQSARAATVACPTMDRRMTVNGLATFLSTNCRTFTIRPAGSLSPRINASSARITLSFSVTHGPNLIAPVGFSTSFPRNQSLIRMTIVEFKPMSTQSPTSPSRARRQRQ